MFVGIDVCFVEVRLSIFRGQFSHVLFIQIKTMFIIAFRFMVIKGMIKGCPYLKIKLRWWKRSIIVKKKELISPLPKPQQEEQGEKEEPPKKEEPHQPPQENKDQLLDKAIEKNPLCLMNLDGVIGQVTIPEQVNIPDQVTTQDGVPLMMIMALEIHPTQHFCQLPLMKMDMDGRE
ncbi:hypothetical protein HN51_066744, partial [Arachis hypogaea]